MLTKIKKRNGDVVDFNKKCIFHAILKSSQATEKKGLIILESAIEYSNKVTDLVVNTLFEQYSNTNYLPNIEIIQDIVEREIVNSGYFEVAREYIVYRADRAQKRMQDRIKELQKVDKNLLKVIKNNGKKEIFSLKKIETFFNRVNKGFENKCKFVELYSVFKTKISDGVKTSEIFNLLKYSSIDLITVENIYWQNIAGRIYILQLYKKACTNRNIIFDDIYLPKTFLEHFKRYLDQGLYYTKFKCYYSLTQLKQAAQFIKKERDYNYIYSTVLAFDKRYLNNPNGKICELPQEMYLCIALFLAIPEPEEKRLSVVKKVYDAISTQKLSLPTPTLLNARTNFHQLASCFKLNTNDDLRSIYHNIENIAQISKFGGGVGIYLGNIRSRSATIRNMQNVSAGVIPWIKVINDTACAVNQLGARKGAVSPTLDIWHKDIKDFLNLQTETGDIRNKAFDIFPAISIPDIFMDRVICDQKWTLFDPHEILQVTGKKLQDLFGKSFEKFYIECETNSKISLKETVSAKNLMKEFLKTAVETGMPYVFFRDTVNKVNPNKHIGNIYSTQLCTEICQNTSSDIFDKETYTKDNKISIQYHPGQVVVCNLASINIAKVHTDAEINAIIPVAMRVLDNTITLNFYPIKEAELTAKQYRSVGLGFMGLAEYLACKGYSYDSKQARNIVDVLFEQYAYATLSASNMLAQERGKYNLYKGSEWDTGKIFARKIDWYKKNTKNPDKWVSLFNKIKQHGLRFSYHLAPAPNTSTAAVIGTTAGVLPIYQKFYVDTGSIAPVVTVAPNLSEKNFWYYKEYTKIDMNDVIDMISVIYKWTDQSISFEWLITPEKTSPQELYDYYIKAWKQGIKTIYYLRSMSGNVSQACNSCSG
jgi:ribonucleoside-diphosphate reductase alpha chain